MQTLYRVLQVLSGSDDTTVRETSVKAAKSEILDALVEAGLSQRDAALTFDLIKARLAIVAAS